MIILYIYIYIYIYIYHEFPDLFQMCSHESTARIASDVTPFSRQSAKSIVWSPQAVPGSFLGIRLHHWDPEPLWKMNFCP